MAETQVAKKRRTLEAEAGYKTFSRSGLYHWLSFGLPFGLALAVYFATAAGGLTWRHGGEDGGDLATAFALGGIPHPTGYPLYLLAGWLFRPFGSDPAATLALASVIWGALAAGLLGQVSYRLNLLCLRPAPASFSLAGALLAGTGLAFTPLVWSQALIVEINSFNLALNLAAVLALLLWWEKKASLPRLLALAFLAGLAIGQHRTAIFTLLALLAFMLAGSRMASTSFSSSFHKINKKIWLGGLSFFGLGLCLPYLYVVLRGGSVPASNWSDAGPANFGGIWQLFTGETYQNLLFAAPLPQSLGRIAASVSLLWQEGSLPGVALGWLGLVMAWRIPAARPAAWLATVGIGLHTAFAAVYAAENSQVYLMPAFALWAALAGLGLAWAGWRSGQLARKLPPGLLPGALFSLALALPLANMALNYSRVNLQGDRQAQQWAGTQLDSAPPGAILVTNSDAATFALWYGSYVEKRRPDVAVIESRLLNQAWYRRNLARLYPDLNIVANSPDLSATNPGHPVRFIPDPLAPGRNLP
ncbi:MAG TPA: DUF2723 domain-containing protein [Chloroflexia bacterium]|nr:DUF2723 domain-containing protein [Chloroflexia bacterium]